VEQLSKRERVMYLRRLAVRSEVVNLSPAERREIKVALLRIADDLERELPLADAPDPIEAMHGHVCSPNCWHNAGR
jgi:hypothetical protein